MNNLGDVRGETKERLPVHWILQPMGRGPRRVSWGGDRAEAEPRQTGYGL